MWPLGAIAASIPRLSDQESEIMPTDSAIVMCNPDTSNPGSRVVMQDNQSAAKFKLADRILMGVAMPIGVTCLFWYGIAYCTVCCGESLLRVFSKTSIGRIAWEDSYALVDLLEELSPGLIDAQRGIGYIASRLPCPIGNLLAGPLPFADGAEHRRSCLHLIDLDELCLSKIISCLDSQDLAALSSTSKSFLRATNSLRSTAHVQACLGAGFFPSFLKRFPNLRVLRIKDPVGAPPERTFGCAAMKRLASNCSELRELHCDRCNGYSAEMDTLMRKCKKLKVLKIRNGSFFSARAAFWFVSCSTISRLEVAELVECPSMKNEDVRALAVACPALRELVLWIVSYGDVNLDAGLAFLSGKCRKLEKLQTTSCGITDRTLASFAAGCKGLRSVSFESEQFLTDYGLHNLITNLTGLSDLYLDSCIQITGKGLHCAQTLRTLSLGRLPRLTESALVNLASLQALRLLSVIDLPALSDAVVETMLRSSSTTLKGVLFSGASRLTRRVLECHVKLGSIQHLWFRGEQFSVLAHSTSPLIQSFCFLLVLPLSCMSILPAVPWYVCFSVQCSVYGAVLCTFSRLQSLGNSRTGLDNRFVTIVNSSWMTEPLLKDSKPMWIYRVILLWFEVTGCYVQARSVSSFTDSHSCLCPRVQVQICISASFWLADRHSI